tara:strand:- start:40319 stop:41419 length:1101 start_codon:yes stop_codon:yes gene_type:complete
MRFSIDGNLITESLQLMMGAIDRRQAVPVLSHVLIEVFEDDLIVTGSDMELEVTAKLPLPEGAVAGEITLPARKLFELCRNLSRSAMLEVEEGQNAIHLQSGRFHSQLKGLPAHDFPRVTIGQAKLEMNIDSAGLFNLITRVDFAMAQQDVRYFFNGMLLEFGQSKLVAVATNGQRLARAETTTDCQETGNIQAIVPRKAVAEILKLIRGEGEVKVSVTRQHLSVERNRVRLTTRLIDATYPDYQRAIPESGAKVLLVDRQELKNALVRISILSNELYRNVRLQLSPGQLQLSANNPLQEEAEEVLAVDYVGDPIEIGFNVSYLIDVLNSLVGDQIQVNLSESGSPAVFVDPGDDTAQYVISPMVL